MGGRVGGKGGGAIYEARVYTGIATETIPRSSVTGCRVKSIGKRKKRGRRRRRNKTRSPGESRRGGGQSTVR